MASSTEAFAALRQGSDADAPSPDTNAADNRRGRISKAYVAVAQVPVRATLRCAACSAYH